MGCLYGVDWLLIQDRGGLLPRRCGAGVKWVKVWDFATIALVLNFVEKLPTDQLAALQMHCVLLLDLHAFGRR